MDPTLIFTVIEKGLTLVPILIQAGTEVIPLINQIRKIAQGGADGTVTQAQLETLEADLDAALDDFNKPMT